MMIDKTKKFAKKYKNYCETKVTTSTKEFEKIVNAYKAKLSEFNGLKMAHEKVVEKSSQIKSNILHLTSQTIHLDQPFNKVYITSLDAQARELSSLGEVAVTELKAESRKKSDAQKILLSSQLREKNAVQNLKKIISQEADKLDDSVLDEFGSSRFLGKDEVKSHNLEVKNLPSSPSVKIVYEKNSTQALKYTSEYAETDSVKAILNIKSDDSASTNPTTHIENISSSIPVTKTARTDGANQKMGTIRSHIETAKRDLPLDNEITTPQSQNTVDKNIGSHQTTTNTERSSINISPSKKKSTPTHKEDVSTINSMQTVSPLETTHESLVSGTIPSPKGEVAQASNLPIKGNSELTESVSTIRVQQKELVNHESTSSPTKETSVTEGTLALQGRNEIQIEKDAHKAPTNTPHIEPTPHAQSSSTIKSQDVDTINPETKLITKTTSIDEELELDSRVIQTTAREELTIKSLQTDDTSPETPTPVPGSTQLLEKSLATVFQEVEKKYPDLLASTGPTAISNDMATIFAPILNQNTSHAPSMNSALSVSNTQSSEMKFNDLISNVKSNHQSSITLQLTERAIPIQSIVISRASDGSLSFRIKLQPNQGKKAEEVAKSIKKTLAEKFSGQSHLNFDIIST